jgi:hypothetical protein
MSQDRMCLRPTPEQYRAFAEYLPRAHSWYKHLPLIGGRRFVVFVAADAGMGRLVAVLHRDDTGVATRCTLVTPPEGPEFTEVHPRLHYGWKTTREYRSRFGCLDYMSRPGPDESYARDAGPLIRLPDQVEERCGFVLYPYVSAMFSDAVTWSIHQEAVARLRAGAPHPAREEVLELASLAEAARSAWLGLGPTDQDWVASRELENEGPTPGEPSVDLQKYLDLDERVRVLTRLLGARENEKVRRALAELDDWLLRDA